MQFAEADADLRQAEILARTCSDSLGLVEHATIRCGMSLRSGDFDLAIGYLGESVDIAHHPDLREQLPLTLAHYAQTLVYMTRFDEAWEAAQESIRVAEANGNLEKVAENLVI